MKTTLLTEAGHNRRALLKKGLAGLGIAGLNANFLAPSLLGQAAQGAAAALAGNKILVVLELSGGNDGLNTVVPYGDDAYYRHRPAIGIPKNQLRLLDDHFGLNPGMAGFERLYKDGNLAIVHGCGYDNPSYSHFSSMAYWHTAAPNSGDEYGWVGRLADAMAPAAPANYVVNIASRQSLAVRSQRHVPVVFDQPERFMRDAFYEEKDALAAVRDAGTVELARDLRDSPGAPVRGFIVRDPGNYTVEFFQWR